MATKAANVYRGYVPIGLPQNRKPNRIKPWWKVIGKPMLTIYPPPEVEEWATKPEYPEIHDGSRGNEKKQHRLNWYKSIRSIPTADEKMYEIAKQARHKAALFRNFWMPNYNSLPMAQYLTYTHLIKDLPEKYKQNTIEGQTIEKVTEILLDKYLCHRQMFQNAPTYLPDATKIFSKEEFKNIELIQDLVGCARRFLVRDNSFILDCQLDLEPTVNSWWWHSGFPPPDNKKWWKSRKDENGYVNTPIQVRGKTALNIRTDSLLRPLVDQNDPLVTDTGLVTQSPFLLKHFGAKFSFRYPVVMPGFRYEDEPRYDCPHTAFLTTHGLKFRSKRSIVPLNDVENALNTQAIMTSFSWLNSLAMNHGFTTYDELTYPLTCQTVTTDGQDWMFHVYQLNTHTFHRDLGVVNKNNICWSSGKLQLFGAYENDRFVNINHDVARMLIQFLTNEPAGFMNENLRPYIGVDERGDEQKQKTRQELQTLFENRFQAYLTQHNRTPLWEHIFIRSKPARYTLPLIKPVYKVGWPEYPKIFD